jgi:hypothetical protein
MLKKCLAFALVFLIVNLSSASAITQTQNDKEAELLRKVKINVAKIGTGRNAETLVSLKDGTKLKGYLVEIKDDGFVVIDKKTAASTPVQYSQVSKVKSTRLPRIAVVAIGAGFAVVLLTVVSLLAVRYGD